MKIVCQACPTEFEVPSAAFLARKKLGLPFSCPDCKNPMAAKSRKSGMTDSQKRSRVQEKRTAAREGGKRQPASGAISGYGGDTRVVGKYRGENKLTRANSYRLNLADLKKLETQASCGEFPIFDIEFQGTNPPKRYVVMPEWVYETLMHDSGRRTNETTGDKNSG